MRIPARRTGARGRYRRRTGTRAAGRRPRESLARDTGLPKSPTSPTEFAIGHNVATEAEVDAVMEQAKRAGATIVKPARKTFWGGYAGCFQDPDGHLREAAFNPSIVPQD